MVYYSIQKISLTASIFIVLSLLTYFSFFIDSEAYAEYDIQYIETSSFFNYISMVSLDDDLKLKIKDRLSTLPSNSFNKNGIIEQLPNENKSDSSKLVVTTQVINDGGGKKKASDFTTIINGKSPDPSTFPGNSKGTTVTIEPGKYSVSEEVILDDYSTNLSTDCKGKIESGDIKYCTITNTYIPTPTPPPPSSSQLIVTTQVINDGGGKKKASDFTTIINGKSPDPSTFPGNSKGTTVTIEPGKYSVSEEVILDDYSTNLSTDCKGKIESGDIKYCTITNTYIPTPTPPPPSSSQLVVTTQVINDGGGKKKASDFTTIINGKSPDPSTFPGNSKGTTVTIEPGKYSVSQKKSSGYSVTKSTSCSGNIKSGETNVCIITNTYSASNIAGTLKVITKVKNNEIGTKKDSDFTVTVYGKDPNPSTFPGNSKGVDVNLKKGSYSVTLDGPSKYSTSYSSKCLGTITSGSQITCTITSEYNPDYTPGTLIVITDVINDNINEDTKKVKPSAFTVKVKGNNPSPQSFPGRSGDGISVNLYPGKYSVSEKGPDGYNVDYSKNCKGKIKADEVKVCNISNEAIYSEPVTPKKNLSILDKITGFSTPSGITFNPHNKLVYISNSGQVNSLGTVAAINSTTKAYDSITVVGIYPQSIVYNSANNFIYTSNTLSNTLSVINATSKLVVDTIRTGTSPSSSLTAISVNSINNTVYLANSADNSVSVINGTSNIAYYNITQTAGNFFTPSSVAYNYDNGNVYVANRGSDKISVLDGTTYTLIDEISNMGIAPSEIIYNSINGNIYVANMGSNSVSVINSTNNTVTETVFTGSRPTGITFSQNTGHVYITNLLDGNISVINGFTNDLITTIPLPINSNPAGIIYDDFEEELYVADINSGIVFVIGSNTIM